MYLLDQFFGWSVTSSLDLITDTQLHVVPLQRQEGDVVVHKGMLDQFTLMQSSCKFTGHLCKQPLVHYYH